MDRISYKYTNIPITGGGYVTGLVFHPNTPDILYARTDNGGTYRYNFGDKCFESLANHVEIRDLAETFPISIAVAATNPDRVYIACGTGNDEYGKLALSYDRGKTFVYRPLPVPAHGNWAGRGAGERLAVSPYNPCEMFFASQRNGLWHSKDNGDTWEQLDVYGEQYMTLVYIIPDTQTIVVGTAGVSTRESDTMRGHSLYVSYDFGKSFRILSEPDIYGGIISSMTGEVAHRCSSDSKYFYVTMNQTAPGIEQPFEAYAAESGKVVAGIVLRYPIFREGMLGNYEMISPSESPLTIRYGYGGISANPNVPGLLVLTTITRDAGDIVYRSTDYGDNWESVLDGMQIGTIEIETEHLKPRNNDNSSPICGLSCAVINPFNPDDLWLTGALGVYGTEEFTQMMPVFRDRCRGIEQSVHMNIYVPPSGQIKILDMVGGLGGFAFYENEEVTASCFLDSNKNRYVTCVNADYSDYNPSVIIVTSRGNYTGSTKGGLILTIDGCKSFSRILMPYGLSAEIDNYFHEIEKPNHNSGWVAMSADSENIVWCVAIQRELPIDGVIYSDDRGNSWKQSVFYQLDGEIRKTGLMKVFADRVKADLFYGFSGDGELFVSRDGGANFYEKKVPSLFRGVDFGALGSADRVDVRVESGHEGVIYIAAGVNGLWKLKYFVDIDEIKMIRLTKSSDVVYRVGLGLISEGSDYMNDPKALYVCGTISGQYGIYCSFDDGESFIRVNEENQMYGDINSIDGDKHVFGRFYVGTGTRGLLRADAESL